MPGTEKLRDAEWLREKVADHSDQDIADMLGCTQPNVTYWRHQHDIEPDMFTYKELRDPEWLEEKLEDNSQSDIARELGCTPALVSERVAEL